MSDKYSDLKKAAERVLAIELTQSEPIGLAYDEFEALANPAAVLAILAENERLIEQVMLLQSDANSWQSGYDEGRRMGTKTALSERAQLKAEAELDILPSGRTKEILDSLHAGKQS